MRVSATFFETGSETASYIEIIGLPDECPICKRSAELKYIQGYVHTHKADKQECLQIVVQCPRNQCRRYSLAYYSCIGTSLKKFRLEYIQPKFTEIKDFPESIKAISPDFIEIYNEARRAEDMKLSRIDGGAYRKALEFLIKDYLIANHPAEEDSIKKEFLGSSISKRIKDDRIKSVSQRAVWLGNDETHYVRTWEGKDVTDLKNLIDLAVYWIDSEDLTKRIEIDMPKPESS